MRLFVSVAAVAAVFALSACDDKKSCTEAEAQAKATEMVTKLQELATKDPAKMAELGTKAAELQAKLPELQADPAKACEAIDEFLKAME